MAEDAPNQIVKIGSTGGYDCYLNVTKERAIERWKIQHPDEEFDEDYLNVEVIPIKDGRFEAYEIWEAS